MARLPERPGCAKKGGLAANTQQLTVIPAAPLFAGLAPHVRSRTSFCYPDSHLEPRHFAVDDVRPLVTLASENELALDPWLDNYIEAHIHGPLSTVDDVDAIVLDRSFRGTSIGKAAGSLGCRVEWHDGFRLPVERIADYEIYRGSGRGERDY